MITLFCPTCSGMYEPGKIQISEYAIKVNLDATVDLEAILVLPCSHCGTGALYHRALGKLDVMHIPATTTVEEPVVAVIGMKSNLINMFVPAPLPPSYKLISALVFKCLLCGLEWGQKWEYTCILEEFGNVPLRIAIPATAEVKSTQAEEEGYFAVGLLPGEESARFN